MKIVKQTNEIQRSKIFYISTELKNKINKKLKESGITFSQIIHDLLVEWVNKKEQERIDREIMEACEFYYDVDKKIAEEWLFAESNV